MNEQSQLTFDLFKILHNFNLEVILYEALVQRVQWNDAEGDPPELPYHIGDASASPDSR